MKSKAREIEIPPEIKRRVSLQTDLIILLSDFDQLAQKTGFLNAQANADHSMTKDYEKSRLDCIILHQKILTKISEI